MENKLIKTAEKIGRALIENNISIACVESCTGGLFAANLTSVSGISQVFEMGMVTYSNRIKSEKLGVRAETLDSFGAVSSQTASEMAYNIRRLAQSDIGISVTGVAGPCESEGKKAGTVFIAIANKDEVHAEQLNITPLSRDYVRECAVEAMFELISKYI